MDIKRKEQVVESGKISKRSSYYPHEGSHIGKACLLHCMGESSSNILTDTGIFSTIFTPYCHIVERM